jgi:hypothetical protein
MSKKNDFAQEARNKISHLGVEKIINGTKKIEEKEATNIPFAEIQRSKKESKSRAMHILVRPSMYNAIVKEAELKELSVNETVNRIFKIWLASNSN